MWLKFYILILLLFVIFFYPSYGQQIVIQSQIEEKASASIRLEGFPDWLAIDEKSVWISNEGLNVLQHLDIKSLRVTAEVGVNKPCAAPTVGFGSIWTISCGDHALVRINQNTALIEAVVPISVASDEGSIVAAEGAVWVLTEQRGILARIDPGRNKVIKEIKVKSNSFAVMAGFGSIWITNTGAEGALEPGSVQRIDPKTNRVLITERAGWRADGRRPSFPARESKRGCESARGAFPTSRQHRE